MITLYYVLFSVPKYNLNFARPFRDATALPPGVSNFWNISKHDILISNFDDF